MKIYNNSFLSSILLFFIVGLICLPLKAQEKRGVITYGAEQLYNRVTVDSSLQKEDPTRYQIQVDIHEQVERGKKMLPELEYVLQFNQEYVHAEMKEIMASDHDKESLQTVLGLAHLNSVFTFDLTKNKFYKEETATAEGDKYLVLQEDFDWQLEEETKEIAGFVCKKATTTIQWNPDSTTEVTAWYAPQINFNYGPKGFYGLPGLILGVEENGYYVYAKEVDLEPKKVKIKKPKGEVVTEEEFNNILDKAREKRTKNWE